MDKQNWYFEQLVTQSQMDAAFDNIESADHNQHTDSGFVGINSGYNVTSNGDLTVAVAAGVAYDAAGQRISGVGDPTLDCSVDYLSNPTVVAVLGNEKWLSVFAVFERSLQTPAVDGNGVSLSYDLVESMTFEVYQEAEAAPGTAAVNIALAAEPYALANGQTLDISVNGTPPQTVTFNSGDFADIANATALEVGAVITAQTSGIITAVSALPGAHIRTVATGTLASIFVTGGSGAAVFAWPSTAGVGAGGPARPALRADAVLICDILLREGSVIIQDAPDGTDSVLDLVGRREWMFVYEGDFDIKVGTTEEFMQAAAGIINSHITDAGNAHPASAITYDPTVIPITGNGPTRWTELKTAGTVQGAIDAFQSILAPTSGTDSGSNNLTFETVADGSVTPGRGTPVWALNSGTGHMRAWPDIQADMLEAFANRLENETVTGDWTISGNPTFTGTSTFTGDLDATAVDVAGILTIPGSIVGPVAGAGSWTWTGSNNVDKVYQRATGADATNDHTYQIYRKGVADFTTPAMRFNFGAVDVAPSFSYETLIPPDSCCIAEYTVVSTDVGGANTYHHHGSIRFNTTNVQILNANTFGTQDIVDGTGGTITVSLLPVAFSPTLSILVTNSSGATDYNVGIHLKLTTISNA
jgi:hypothetical protein